MDKEEKTVLPEAYYKIETLTWKFSCSCFQLQATVVFATALCNVHLEVFQIWHPTFQEQLQLFQR